MTDELDKLRELERAATDGPWKLAGKYESSIWKKGLFDGTNTIPDARFIAAFRNCAKELLDVAEATKIVHNVCPASAKFGPGECELCDALDRLKAKVREVVK